MRRLTLHIGLEKTGTTTLQRDLFPSYPGFIGGFSTRREDIPVSNGNFGPDSPPDRFLGPFYALYVRDGRLRDVENARWRADVRAWWRSLPSSPRDLFLSSELLSKWPTAAAPDFFRGQFSPEAQRLGPHPVISFLAALAAELDGAARIQSVVTLRNQADFLGSLYAQTSIKLTDASQKDFATRVMHLIESGDDFLNWDSLIGGLQASLGAENVCVALFEDGVAAVGDAISDFLGFESDNAFALGLHNVREAREGGWGIHSASVRTQRLGRLVRVIRTVDRRLGAIPPRTKAVLEALLRVPGARTAVSRHLARTEKLLKRGRTDRIVVTDDLRAAIKQFCSEQNTQLSARLDRDLASLGY